VGSGIGGLLALLGIAALVGGRGAGRGDTDDSGRDVGFFGFPGRGIDAFPGRGDFPGLGGGSGGDGGPEDGGGGVFNLFTPGDSVDSQSLGQAFGFEDSILPVSEVLAPRPSFGTPSQTFAVTPITEAAVADILATPSQTFAVTPITEAAVADPVSEAAIANPFSGPTAPAAAIPVSDGPFA